MTPGKAGGLFGQRLKVHDNTVSRLKAAVTPRASYLIHVPSKSREDAFSFVWG